MVVDVAPGNSPLHLLPTWWVRLEYSKERMKTFICKNYGEKR